MRTGVWLIGARGSVATATVIGAAALRARLVPPVGCVSELPDFAGAHLPDVADLVFGGHDVTGIPLAKRAEQLARGGAVPEHVVRQVGQAIEAAEAEIRPGHQDGDPGQAVERLRGDLADFRRRHDLERVVVINVASTQPRSEPHPATRDLTSLEADLHVLDSSSLYAYAAMGGGCAYVDFTPSTGGRLPALRELALSRGVPYAGSDAKTGETLVKSVLAPMFAQRALRVRSWSGTNLLGGGDGQTLADPLAAGSKISSKGRLTTEVLGYPVDGDIHIDYVPDLGDWKTAWDHVSFEGFLGVGMTLQFTWQGCDSTLAAPLVLDLARFMSAAQTAGRAGPVPELGFFFKDPVDTTQHALSRQFDALVAWAGAL